VYQRARVDIAEISRRIADPIGTSFLRKNDGRDDYGDERKNGRMSHDLSRKNRNRRT
jgi:hypothetical protein